MAILSIKLSTDLKTELRKADEIWVAVGLLNNNGLEFILQTIPKTCKLNFVVGIDLPTDPKALSKLLSLKGKRTITAKILTEDFFHPKVYVIKSRRQVIAFVGSANCTNGGLVDNIEMSIGTKDNNVCKELIEWFEKTLLPASQPLTLDFIKDYKPKYDNRIKGRKKEKEEIGRLKEEEQIKLQANIKLKTKLISELKRFRRNKDYQEDKRKRQIVVKILKDSLGYPNFKNLDLDTFFRTKELGTIDRRKTRRIIENNLQQFAKLMKYICDENIPIQQRFDNALNGTLSLPNIARGFISKVLVIHKPKKYYLHNDAFADRLRPFGLSLPRGLSFGEKYELTRDILKEIMIEANIDDFATLDLCFWRIGED